MVNKYLLVARPPPFLVMKVKFTQDCGNRKAGEVVDYKDVRWVNDYLLANGIAKKFTKEEKFERKTKDVKG